MEAARLRSRIGNLIAKALIAAGADLESENWFGHTAYDIAKRSGNKRMSDLLLKTGHRPLLIGAMLVDAVIDSDLNYAKIALVSGANPDPAIMMLAARRAGPDMMALLLRHGGDPSTECGGVSALAVAEANGNPEVADLLRPL